MHARAIWPLPAAVALACLSVPAATAAPFAAATAASGFAVATAASVPAATAAPASPWQSAEVPSPPGGSYGDLYSITCSAPTTCVAGGSYYSAAKTTLPMVAAESAGKWGTAQTLRLPAGALTTDQDAVVSSVACPGPRGPKACVAVGDYDDAAGLQGFVAEGSGSSWGRASRLVPPAKAGQESTTALSGVTCTAPGTCVAVGLYTTTTGLQQGLVLTESRGHWLRAAGIRSPGNVAATDSGAHLASVSCQAPGDCVAVGAYSARSGASDDMAAAEKNGRWGAATQTPVPANAPAQPQAELYSVSCLPHRYCVAVGSYFTDHGNDDVMAVFDYGGRWQRPADLTALPANVSTPNPYASLNGVSCADLTCTAVGYYRDKQGTQVMMAMSESGGEWTRAAQVGLPAHAARSGQHAYLFAVACEPDFCGAAGQYVNSSDVPEAMAARRLGIG
jgi:hypothetical protein